MTDSKMPDILYAWPAEGEKSPGVMLCGQWSVTRYPDQAEEYRKAAPVADAGKRDGMAAYDCQKCGRRIPVDTVVADEVWRAISPTGDEGGLLCAACIADALAASGWPAVRMINAHLAPVADAKLEALLGLPLDDRDNACQLCADADATHFSNGDLCCDDCYMRRLENTLCARTAQPVGVGAKPLTWHPGHGCTGSGLGLEYHMGETDPGMFELYSPIKFGPASKAECQAAAQADYKQRIRSQVIAAPITVQDAARVLLEALERAQIDLTILRLLLNGEPRSALQALSDLLPEGGA